ncbi:MAG: PAS domain S-box protein, partial [bacterium]|nr:PAS domain S-box protein [bacterium]
MIDETGSIIQWNEAQEKIYGIKRHQVAEKKIWDIQFQFEPKAKQIEKNDKKIKNMWENFLKSGINPFLGDIRETQI